MGHFYVDPIAIAESHGIRVEGVPGLEGGVNGIIMRDSNGAIVIKYDSRMHENRQRFTIAHELGHFFHGHLDENHKMFRDPHKNFSLEHYDPKEAEANRYAARLLMPKEKIDFLLYKEGITSIDRMAKLLRVSPAAMTYRLQNLGYIS